MGLLDTKQQQPVGGLLGGGQRQRQQPSMEWLLGPQGAAPAQPVQGPGFLDYALATVAGGLPGVAGLALRTRQQKRASSASEKQIGQLDDLANRLDLDPQTRLLLRADPAKFAEVLAKNAEGYTLSEGQVRGQGGQTVQAAPKYGEDGGFLYSQGPDGMTWGDQRGINHVEAEANRSNVANETQAVNVLNEAKRHNLRGEDIDFGQLGVAEGQLGVSRGQLGLAGQRLAFDKTGGVAGVNGGANGKPTDAQAQAGFNASRLANAGRTLGAIEKSGFNPGVGMLGGGLNVAAGGNTARQYEQSENEWSDALLRLTSGAQASKEEIAQTRATYFPKLGDSPQVRAQKAAARAAVERQAVRRAGPAGQQPAAAPADPLGIR